MQTPEEPFTKSFSLRLRAKILYRDCCESAVHRRLNHGRAQGVFRLFLSHTSCSALPLLPNVQLKLPADLGQAVPQLIDQHSSLPSERATDRPIDRTNHHRPRLIGKTDKKPSTFRFTASCQTEELTHSVLVVTKPRCDV